MRGLHAILAAAACLMGHLPAMAQAPTLADTLRGTLTAARTCFDVHFYDLHVEVDIDRRSISGSNTVHFTTVEKFYILQLDLFAHMAIDSITHRSGHLPYERVHGAVFIRFPKKMTPGERDSLTVHYHGKPIAAKNAPWDGGFVWGKDGNGKPHVGVACEQLGASSWWPCKDHLSDEPDSVRMRYTVPDGLMCVGNGQAMPVVRGKGKATYGWRVTYPINNYNVTLNIGDFVHLTDVHLSGSDSLRLNYYVLRQNEAKAREHFQQVGPMLRVFEGAFGQYPFLRDGYALVETPYVGMEHQSAIAYGNRYMKGYLGRFTADMDFDYIIIHETGHEWWGNSVSAKDLADMWVHESFCTYSESVFVEATYGYENMMAYLASQRTMIRNRGPVRGEFGVARPGDTGDMYYKGAWMLHTLRSLLNDDPRFKEVVRSLALHFKHRTVDGDEVIAYICDYTNRELRPFFRQYLDHAELPVLEYRIEGRQVEMRFLAAEEGFAMPVEAVMPSGAILRTKPIGKDWEPLTIGKGDPEKVRFREDRFLMEVRRAGR